MMYLNQSILHYILNIQNSLGKTSGWIIDSVINNNSNILKYNPFAGITYKK